MRMAVAQVRSLRGDVEGNIARHLHVVEAAQAHAVELLVFPELSLTQYDPALAKETALSEGDPRLAQLQKASDESGVAFCVGAPLRSDGGITISMLIFRPHHLIEVYTKRHLHADEEPFFVPGDTVPARSAVPEGLAFAICYEISVPQHAEEAHRRGATIYMASVAKTPAGVVRAEQRLAQVASTHNMTVFLANCVGPCEGSVGGGRSAVWGPDGTVLAQLGDEEEGIIAYDPHTPHHAPDVIPVPSVLTK